MVNIVRKIRNLARNRVTLFSHVRWSATKVANFLAKIGVHKRVPMTEFLYSSIMGDDEGVVG